jgi:biofilm protein TabA
MIVTDIKTISLNNPRLLKLINKALEYANEGKTGKFSLQDDDITLTISEDILEDQNSRKLEMHREYADVQIVLEGKERYGYMIGSYEGKLETDNLSSNDLAFLPSEQNCQYTDISQHQFVVFLPHTPHKPLCICDPAVKKVKKAIIKIRKNRLEEFFGLEVKDHD